MVMVANTNMPFIVMGMVDKPPQYGRSINENTNMMVFKSESDRAKNCNVLF